MSATPRKLVVITGVSKGVGKSIALEFIERGEFTVIGCARSEGAIKQLNKEFNKKDHRFDVVDVSNYNVVKTWLSDVVNTYGIPDIVLNNAAILNRKKQFMDEPIEYYHKVMSVNIFGILYITHIMLNFIRLFDERRKTIKILNFTSINGLMGFDGNSGYNASKHAIDGLSKSIGKELVNFNNVIICAFNPGNVSTTMLSDFCDSTIDGVLKIGATDIRKWGKLNYDFIVNQINKEEHHGKHVFSVDCVRSNVEVFGIDEEYFRKYKIISKY